MKKVLFTILILFIASCSKEISFDRIVERDNLAYEVNSQTPYNGKALIYFENGQVELQVTYKNGEMDKRESYYENGQLEYKATYKNGEIVKRESYYENGELIEENYDQDGKIIKNMEKNMTLVTIKTSVGEIKLELDDEKAPITVENFKTIANSGYYEGTIFHRVINGFMVQGGGLTADMSNKSSGTAPIQNEANNGLSNDRGTIAMARTMDPHSATGQFFINHKDNGFLNHTGENPQGWGYAVFGAVTEGMDVVDQIADVATGTSGGHQDVPVDTITIESVTISE